MLQMDIPEPMIDLQVKQMADDFAMRIQQQGLYYGAVLPVYRYD